MAQVQGGQFVKLVTNPSGSEFLQRKRGTAKALLLAVRSALSSVTDVFGRPGASQTVEVAPAKGHRFPWIHTIDGGKRRTVSVVFAIFVAIATSITFAIDSLHAQTSELSASRPNVVVIMTDDLDVGSMEVLINSNLMPNLKRYISDQGIKFSESFVTNAVCCPSRATFLSGQYSHNHKTFTVMSINGSVTAFDDSSTLATWLQDSGYRTGHIGKYLNGYGSLNEFAHDPELLEQVRDFWQAQDPEGAKRLEPTYIPPGWDDWRALVDQSTYCVYNYTMNENGRIRDYMKNGQILEDGIEIRPPQNDEKLHYYQTDVIASHATDFIQRSENTDDAQPFFLAVMPIAPHIEMCGQRDPDGPVNAWDEYKNQFEHSIRPAPRHEKLLPLLKLAGAKRLLNKPSFNESDISDKPLEMRLKLRRLDLKDISHLVNQYADRLASMMAVDDLIGVIVNELQRTDELDDTVIVFTSDNGWFQGEHRLSAKHLAYEEAIRVPLYVRLPHMSRPQERTQMVINNDLAPTIADLAGAKTEDRVDGRTLVPLFENVEIPQWRNRFLVEHYLGIWSDDPHRIFEYANLFAVRTGDSSILPNRSYIEHFRGIQRKEGYYLNKGQSEPTGEYVWEARPIDMEYYDLNEDPYQLENYLFDLGLNPAPLQVIAEQTQLRTWLIELLQCVNNECREIEDR